MSQRRKLPQVWRHVMWHSAAGLVVSPFSRELPIETAGSSTDQDGYSKPRKVSDAEVYLAFYPCRYYDRGELFSVISLSVEDISAAIEEIPFTDPQRYVLKGSIIDSWAALENALLTIGQELLDHHRHRAYFPRLQYPRWPHQYGYRAGHSSKQLALACARRARDAFRLLSAFTTFALSLWLTEYEDNCFDSAFFLLASLSEDPVPQSYLQLIRQSIVCNLTPGLRPGCFLDPYFTTWGPHLGSFCRAGVPVWLLWGKTYKEVVPLDVKMVEEYLAPDQYIEVAKRRALVYSGAILPTKETHVVRMDSVDLSNIPFAGPVLHFPDGVLPMPGRTSVRGAPLPEFATVDNGDQFSSQGSSDDPPPPPPAVDRTLVVDERSGEMWNDFFARMEASFAKRKDNESAQERQSRESIERNAEKSGYSNKTPVFLWEQDEVNEFFWRRTRLDKSDVSLHWGDYTPFQRKFWSHTREWDLCPQLPRFPNGANPREYEKPVEEIEDMDDERFNLLYSKPPVQPPKKPGDEHAVGMPLKMLSAVRAAAAYDANNSPNVFPFQPLIRHLKLRHGFDAEPIETWTPSLHDRAGGRAYAQRTDDALVLKRLLYTHAPPSLIPTSPTVKVSIIDFYNTAVAVSADGKRRTSYVDLPPAWDIAESLIISFTQVRVQRVESLLSDSKTLYILRPGGRSKDTSSWFVATRSATVVLLVYRSGWATMLEIARGLLELGITFNTVEERKTNKKNPQLWRTREAGLGSRPAGFVPAEEDYLAYLSARDAVLRSKSGRAIRLAGGIAGRIAAEVVPDVDVLDGPVVGDADIGCHGDFVYVDDALSEEKLDVVCGVYHVQKADMAGRPAQHSWWPKQSSWWSMAYSEMQWQPDAEDFYQKRLAAFQTKKYALLNATQWRTSYKYDKKYEDLLHAGSEALASEYIAWSRRMG